MNYFSIPSSFFILYFRSPKIPWRWSSERSTKIDSRPKNEYGKQNPRRLFSITCAENNVNGIPTGHTTCIVISCDGYVPADQTDQPSDARRLTFIKQGELGEVMRKIDNVALGIKDRERAKPDTDKQILIYSYKKLTILILKIVILGST